MRSTLWWSLLIVCIVSTFTAAFAQSGGGGTGGVTVVSDFDVQLTANSGQRLSGAVRLQNSGLEPARVRLASGDFLVIGLATVSTLPLGSVETSSAPWFSSAAEVVVPPQATLSVPYEYLIPDGAPAGTYWSLILVQPAGAVTSDDRTMGEVRTSVQIAVQYGITVLIDVGTVDGPYPMSFVEPALSLRDDGRTVLELALQHDGPHLQMAESRLELYTETGTLFATVEGGRARIYPGHPRRRSFDLGVLPPGRYQAIVIADTGDDHVAGVRFDIDTREP